MKQNFYIFFLLIILIQNAFALTRTDVLVIEATENIQYLGEKIATDYFRLYNRPNDFSLQNQFKENIRELEKDISTINTISKDPVTRKILEFYKYRLSTIKRLAIEKPTRSNAKAILKASEVFFEGARSIFKQHHYKSSKEEIMLVRCKELKYLIESVSKYYMAFQIGLKSKKHTIEMQKIIQNINHDLKVITNYSYPNKLEKKLENIKNIWQYNQTFFKNLQEAGFTNLLLSSNSYIKTLLMDLEEHHKENL